jgi:hypothetical protein
MRPAVLTDKEPIIKNQPTLMLIEMESGLTHLTYFFRNTNSSETTSNGIIYYISLLSLYIKLFWMKRKKRGERDGMNRKRKCGRNASIPWLACPPQLKSINTSKVILAYIPVKQVAESIQWLCLESIRFPPVG